MLLLQDLVTELVVGKLREHVDAQVVLLDGFPRDKEQVEALNFYVRITCLYHVFVLCAETTCLYYVPKPRVYTMY